MNTEIIVSNKLSLLCQSFIVGVCEFTLFQWQTFMNLSRKQQSMNTFEGKLTKEVMIFFHDVTVIVSGNETF